MAQPNNNYFQIPDYQSLSNSVIQKVLMTHQSSEISVDAHKLLSIAKTVLFQNDTFDVSWEASPKVSYDIVKISREIACKCSDMDLDSRIIAFLESLSKYSWEAKMAIIVAAFAVYYGEFRLLLNNSTSFVAAKILQLKNIKIQDFKEVRASMDEIFETIKKAMSVTTIMLRFYDYPSILRDVNNTGRAAYWIISTVVVCTKYIASLGTVNQVTNANLKNATVGLLNGMDHYENLMKQELLLPFNPKIDNDSVFIKKFLDIANQNIVKIFEGLFVKGNEATLWDCKTKKTVGFNILKGAKVLILISGSNTEKQKIDSLLDFYKTQMKEKYKLVWFPFDHSLSSTNFSQIEMPWYTVKSISDSIKEEFISYIKEKWLDVTHQTIVVPLIEGVIPKAYPLGHLLIYEDGENIFTNNSIAPWNKTHLTLKLLLGGIYSNNKPNSIVCLYGGEGYSWINSTFPGMINALKGKVKLEICAVYVSRKEACDYENETIFKIIEGQKNLCWKAEGTSSWLFWEKVESIFICGAQNNKNPKDDNIMKELMTLLDFNSDFRGWAVFGRLGSPGKIVLTKGKALCAVLKNGGDWNENTTDADKFLTELNNKCQDEVNKQPHHCSRIILSEAMAGIVKDVLSCSTCDARMGRKSLMYRCG